MAQTCPKDGGKLKVLTGIKDPTIEDMFPSAYYLQFVEKAYAKEFAESKVKEKLSPPAAGEPMVRYVEGFFKRYKLDEFHKTRPARLIYHALSENGQKELPADAKKNFEALFKGINKRFPRKKTQ